MATFIAKQMVGSQLKSVKGALGGEDKEEKTEGAEEGEEDPELAEARREAEERRQERHRKQEEEREKMRQDIRDKYGIKKREVEGPKEDPDVEGRLGRKKKTPAEMAAEAAAAEEEEDSFLPPQLNEITAKMKDLPNSLKTSVGEVTEKCAVM